LHLWFVYSWNSKAWVPYKSILFLEWKFLYSLNLHGMFIILGKI
jgi:hypothetical protein